MDEARDVLPNSQTPNDLSRWEVTVALWRGGPTRIFDWSMEHNLTLGDGLDRVSRWMLAHVGMWPAVAFRVLAVEEDDGGLVPTMRLLAAHFQASPTPQAINSKIRLPAPTVIEGAIAIKEFATLIDRWTAGAAGLIDHWLLKAPNGLANFWWQHDVPVADGQFPLIEDLPEYPTTFREARLSGSGEQIDQTTRSWLQDRLYDLDSSRAHAAVFSRDYLSLAWGMDSTYLLIQLPLALALDARYDADEHQVLVRTHYRPPIKPHDLEVRVGSGLYDASLPVLVPVPAGRDDHHWDLAVNQVSRDPGGSAKVWLSRVGMEAAFGWELTVDLGRAKSPELRRERFLETWYAIGRRAFAEEVETRMPGTGKGDRPGDAFELAIANACGALGFGVLFAGHLLQSAGVDIIAFDYTTKRVYAISATVGNDIAGKLRALLGMEQYLERGLAPEWLPRPVILTSQPGASLVEQDLRSCYARKVLVLASEQLAPLKETPPDLPLFGRFLAMDPPDVTSQSPRFGRMR
jgi:hypothetical protein